MRKVSVALLVALLSLRLTAATDSKTALLNELISLTHGDDAAIEALLLSLGGTNVEPEAMRAGISGMPAADQQKIRTAASRVTFAILAEHLTEAQLRGIVAFLKTDAGRAYCDALGALARERPAAVVVALHPPEPLHVVQARRTMADMRSLATAAEAYAIDMNRYPDGRNVADLKPVLSPTYIRTPPRTDAWGTPFAYRVSADHATYRFVSAGPDRHFEPSSLDITQIPRKSDDIVYQNAEFLQAPLN